VTVDIGAQVEHGGEAAELVGHHAGDGGAIDAFQRLEQVARHGHQGACVAGRHAGMRGRFAINRLVGQLQLLDGDPHAGVFLATQGDLHRIVHLDHFGSGHDGAARPSRRLGQRLGTPDQQQLGIGMRLQESLASHQRDRRSVVSAHAVHRQTNHASYR